MFKREQPALGTASVLATSIWAMSIQRQLYLHATLKLGYKNNCYINSTFNSGCACC